MFLTIELTNFKIFGRPRCSMQSTLLGFQYENAKTFQEFCEYMAKEHGTSEQVDTGR